MLSQTVLVKNKNIGLKLARFSFLLQSKRFIKILILSLAVKPT